MDKHVVKFYIQVNYGNDAAEVSRTTEKCEQDGIIHGKDCKASQAWNTQAQPQIEKIKILECGVYSSTRSTKCLVKSAVTNFSHDPELGLITITLQHPCVWRKQWMSSGKLVIYQHVLCKIPITLKDGRLTLRTRLILFHINISRKEIICLEFLLFL